MTFNLKVASISDIHLGHKQTGTEHLLKSLRLAFKDIKHSSQLDLIFIGGDLFDGPLHYYSEEAFQIQLWMLDFLKMASQYDIAVRVLEGTRSHDWGQNRWFEVVNEMSGLHVDLKYIKDLSIEHLERFDATVLYVPDNWAPSTDDTRLQVQQLLQQHGLSGVDFVVLHGAFDEQLPAYVHCQKHSAQFYDSIAKRQVFAGHIHQSWVHGKILGNGSFDRLAHGEESPKGHWRVHYTDMHSEVRFIENKNAMIYRTIDCVGKTLEEAMAIITPIATAIPPHSRLRLLANTKDPILANLDTLRKQYPSIYWSSKVAEEQEFVDSMILQVKEQASVEVLNATTARALIERALEQRQIPEVLRQRCMQTLTEIGVQ